MRKTLALMAFITYSEKHFSCIIIQYTRELAVMLYCVYVCQSALMQKTLALMAFTCHALMQKTLALMTFTCRSGENHFSIACIT